MVGLKSNKIIKIIVEISRILLGATFVFSGFVKSVDPYGTMYKIEDYLTVFGMPSLTFLALPLSFFLCGMEFIIGSFMLLGIYRRWNSILMFVVMIFMTLLTLYLAIANPVMDCGCFGDALILTNWQTFYKNIILLICSTIVLRHYECISNFFTGKIYWLAFLYIIIFISGFIIRNYWYDPLLDFRPYRIGINIPQGMKVEEGKDRLEESILVYAKDGIEKEFTQDNFPWEDSTWTFVKMYTKVIREGEKAKIHDFRINKLIFDKKLSDIIGEKDITESVLTDSNYVFLMISPFLSDMDEDYISNIEDVMNYANDYHYRFYCLTASPTSEILDWEKENKIDLNFCRTDDRVLKTIIRTNPGLLLIKNGTIVNKWHSSIIPSEENLSKPLTELPYSRIIDQNTKDKNDIIYISLIFILPLLILKGVDLLLFHKKEEEINGQCN